MVSFPTQGGTKLTQEQILFFEESYTKYYRMMVQTVLPIVGSRDIAEDIVADPFLILLANGARAAGQVAVPCAEKQRHQRIPRAVQTRGRAA